MLFLTWKSRDGQLLELLLCSLKLPLTQCVITLPPPCVGAHSYMCYPMSDCKMPLQLQTTWSHSKPDKWSKCCTRFIHHFGLQTPSQKTLAKVHLHLIGQNYHVETLLAIRKAGKVSTFCFAMYFCNINQQIHAW